MQAARTADTQTHRAVLPSWLLSALFHVLAMLALAWLIQGSPRGIAEEPARGAGIVLKHFSSDTEYFDGEQQGQQAEENPAEKQPLDLATALPNDRSAPLDTQSALPEKLPVIGAGALERGGISGAGELAAGARQPKAIQGGKARIGVYNVYGEGQKFVFVFDRSESMAGAPLASAKAQLLSSLEGLEDTHQFQIIFFNHEVRIFDLSGGQNRIPFAGKRAKGLAAKFVGGITASGGTKRYQALAAALRIRPDVIFFLTDVSDAGGNLDAMTAGELERVRRLNRGGTAIHAIHFGSGPLLDRNNFLMRLAAQNSGDYVYVDTSKLTQ